MQISVINLTTGPNAVSRAKVIQVVRAVNRQLEEDFFPYWHIRGQLRLDPEAGTPGDQRQRHDALRGDGILYLMTSPEQTNLLGFHERHLDGIPFGFVFTEVSAALGEDWSVTLSHEAIELIADPDVNLLCRGPHPDPKQNGRVVFHWFELCDAVQSESYEIDGVRVSNFVLPAYYTSGEERAGHNDFLSTVVRTAPQKLQSFGTNPGGYVGFWDISASKDDTYNDPRAGEGQDAAKRAAAKEKAMAGVVVARRKDRRSIGGVNRPDPLEAIAPLPFGQPKFESLLFRVAVPRAGAAPADVARAVASETVPPDWEVTPFPGGAADFEVRPRAGRVAVGEAWELLYRLRAHARVVRADGLFEFAPADAERAKAPDGVRASGGGDKPLPGAAGDCEWSVKVSRVKEAWALMKPAGRQGAGIVVAHPDTGYTEHPEIQRALSLNDALDLVDGGPAVDPLDEGVLLQPSHGTSTASVIVSDEGLPQGGAPVAAPAKPFVTGVAPAAKIVPIRVAPSVLHFSMRNVTKAIRHAAARGCHVISMSLGGPFGWGFLHDAIRDATDQGIIVLAAAGNEVGFVVYPAAFDEVVAVAACNVELRPWRGSSHGSAVDVCAPGESVWRARTARGSGEALVYSVEMGSGTSYAVASVAGAAALWLAHHGRQNLLERYGAGALVSVFKQVLIASCRKLPNWNDREYGAGIIDAKALLEAKLPDAAPARGMRAVRGALATAVDASGLRKVLHLFEGEAPAGVRKALCQLVGRSDEQLDEQLEEIGDELAMHLSMDATLRAAVRQSARADGRDAHAAGASAQTLGTARTRLASVGSPRLVRL